MGKLMDVRHATHGKHRRRTTHRVLLVAIGLVAVAGLTVAVLWTRGPATPHGSAQAGSSTAHGTVAKRSATSTPPAPAPSSATPAAGAPVAVGKAPHFVAIAPDGRFAYI